MITLNGNNKVKLSLLSNFNVKLGVENGCFPCFICRKMLIKNFYEKTFNILYFGG